MKLPVWGGVAPALTVGIFAVQASSADSSAGDAGSGDRAPPGLIMNRRVMGPDAKVKVRCSSAETFYRSMSTAECQEACFEHCRGVGGSLLIEGKEAFEKGCLAHLPAECRIEFEAEYTMGSSAAHSCFNAPTLIQPGKARLSFLPIATLKSDEETTTEPIETTERTGRMERQSALRGAGLGETTLRRYSSKDEDRWSDRWIENDPALLPVEDYKMVDSRLDLNVTNAFCANFQNPEENGENGEHSDSNSALYEQCLQDVLDIRAEEVKAMDWLYLQINKFDQIPETCTTDNYSKDYSNWPLALEKSSPNLDEAYRFISTGLTDPLRPQIGADFFSPSFLLPTCPSSIIPQLRRLLAVDGFAVLHLLIKAATFGTK